jgi:hypothetical protein
LIRGADRNASDANGKTPLDRVTDKMPEHLQEELKQILSHQSYWQCMMMKVPLVPIHKNHKT